MSAPVLITLRDRILSVAARFRAQYEGKAYWNAPLRCGRTAREIAEALDALDLETCTAADVDVVVGGSGWCGSRCDGCEESTEGSVVQVGEGPDYDSSTASLCIPCLLAAMALVSP